MGQFHIISIVVRRFPGDRAYTIRETFEADSLHAACANHAAYRQSGVRCFVLRDGSTGARYSLEQSRHIAQVAA